MAIKTNGNTRSNTPRRAPSVARLAAEIIKRERVMEEFPEFPPAPMDYDPNAYIDETMSIAASVDDDSSLDFDLIPDDDLYPPPADLAEEAAGIDDEIISDRMYKALMAKNGNTLNAEVNNIVVAVNIFNKNTKVMGKADSVELGYLLNVARQSVYDAMRAKLSPPPLDHALQPQVTFEVSAPAETSISLVNLKVTELNAKLDDEVVAHLAAFALDEQVLENKVRLSVAVQKSNIEIKDRKKKKPLRIKIRDLVIEQDEDARTDVEED